MTLHRADPRTSEPTADHFGCTAERCAEDDSLTCPAIRWPGRYQMPESIAESLGRSPRVEIIRVIEVRFLRGAGIAPHDPVREVVALFREDGAPIVELDAFAGSDRADPPC